MNQMSLLPKEASFTEGRLSTLHITYENQRVVMDIPEIFDAEKYDSLTGVTYSVSPGFMNRYLSPFRQVELVVGIPETRVQDRANRMEKQLQQIIQMDLRNESTAFYQELQTPVKKQIAERSLVIKVPLGYSIHSKFYLLRHTKTDENRLILGSANLSEQAFKSETPQFENIVIFDNHPLFAQYFDCYRDELSRVLVNYFPKELLAKNADRVRGVTAV